MSGDIESRYYRELAGAFVRGRLPDAPGAEPDDLLRFGIAAGLRLHKFKRSTPLPRARRVFGFLRQMQPTSLLDIGSGRGVFLWPLLDLFKDLSVHCVEVRADRVADIQAVHAGGIARVSASIGDVTALPIEDDAFDGVTMLEVLEHVEHPHRAVAEAVRIGRRFVIVSVPSKPDDNPEHIRLFDRQSLEKLFHDTGARRISIEYIRNHIVALAIVDGS